MTTDQDPSTGMNPDDLASLRQAAEDGRKASRELAFFKAGVDVTSPVGAMFVKGYDGELEPAAIKADWDALGVAVSPATTPPPVAAQAAAPPATAAGTPPPDPRPDSGTMMDPRVLVQQGQVAHPDMGNRPEDLPPGVLGMQRYQEALADPSVRQSAADAYFGTMFEAAKRGDPRVIGNASQVANYQP